MTAGQTAFMAYKLVRGKLIKSFDFYQTLQHPFARAAYIVFVVSGAHPFLDGNGRVARVVMNAELVKANQTQVIIPAYSMHKKTPQILRFKGFWWFLGFAKSG